MAIKRLVKRRTAVRTTVFTLAVSIGAVLLGAASWIRRTFGPISVDQMLMHLPGAGGAETTGAESGYVVTFLLQAIVLPLGVVVVALAIAVANHRFKRPELANVSKVRKGLERIADSIRLVRWVPCALSVGVFVLGAAVFVQAVGLPQYIRSSQTSLTMGSYYAAPTLGDARAVSSEANVGDKKNLVLIFLESMETALADDELFEANMLAPLEEATEGWETIPALEQYPGGGWTMAGIVGTECGVPLRGPGVGKSDINSNDIGVYSESYLPGATCLGDVLSDAGYTNTFLGGADAEFAAKENFLRSHGYDVVKDLPYWQESGETEFSDWGLSDRALMEQAKHEVTELHESGVPFNLTLLTLDSHEPSNIFDYCSADTKSPMVSASRCSMEQVAGFVNYLDEMGYLEDTVVVLTGDHRKMISEGGNFWDELSAHDDRTIFNRFWTPDEISIARERTDQLSMFPTMLDLLDLGREDKKGGIGVSALVSKTEGMSVLDLGDGEYAEVVESRSADLYRDLWRSIRTNAEIPE